MIVTFYNSEEIVAAKHALWKNCNEELGSFPLRQNSTNRLAIVVHMEDIFEGIKSLDEKEKLPVFVAKDLNRIPNALPEELNILYIITHVAELEKHCVQTHTTL